MPDIGHGAGDYSNRIIIEQNVPIDNPDGQSVQNWVFFANRWAQIIPRGGREVKPFLQLRVEIDHVIRLRSDRLTRLIIPTNFRFRLLVDGTVNTTFNIDSRQDTNYRRIELEFNCIEWEK
jgi:SPP1 family predicted phage head-tail adaptor